MHIKRHTNLSAEAGEGQPFPGSLSCGGCVTSARWWHIMHRPCTSALVPLAPFQTCTHLHFFIKSLPFSAERPGRLVLSSTPASVSSGKSRDKRCGQKSLGNCLCPQSYCTKGVTGNMLPADYLSCNLYPYGRLSAPWQQAKDTVLSRR